MPKTSPRAAGFLAMGTKDEKIFPIPIQPSASAITAKPVINFAASASIILFLLFVSS